jgi:hypothetical protein
MALACFCAAVGWEAIGGEPLVGGLFGLVVLLGFEAEGNGADNRGTDQRWKILLLLS